ncbi:peptidoglycan-binding domain-containing protein [Amaricoccus solimangrovi]|nr:peptidoglycan-binding domain-containing protein [Amaricoccus solimangrovi]
MSSAMLGALSAGGARANGFWDSFGGSVAGTVVGNAITNHVTQPRRTYVRTERVYVAPRVDSAQRAQNRRVQTALNYFGFPAGAPDGVIGPGTRAASATYQAYMGYPSTGYLTDPEAGTLLGAYDWAVAGGPGVNQALASGQGGRGLLVAYRQMLAGAPQAPVAPQPAPIAAAAPAPVPAAAPAPEPEPAPVAAAPEPEPAAPALPTFIAATSPAPSMAGACGKVAVATSANGGPRTLGAGLDTDQMLAEQFCLGRSYAIDQGESLAATVAGVSQDDITAQCVAFAPALRDYVARLPGARVDTMLADLRQFVAETGYPPEQLSANARICLGVGYRIDDASVALASAMVLAGLNEAAYAELIGEQLRMGLGVPARRELGLEWVAAAVDGLRQGATPLISANAQDRLALLSAAMPAAGSAERPVPVSAKPAAGFALPMAKEN